MMITKKSMCYKLYPPEMICAVSCHPGILSLWESGDEAQRDMVHCLYHYFLNGQNISAAADAIHIHRNTLIYRLSKIEKILNIDIKKSSPKQSFLFIISYLIVKHL